MIPFINRTYWSGVQERWYSNAERNSVGIIKDGIVLEMRFG